MVNSELWDFDFVKWEMLSASEFPSLLLRLINDCSKKEATRLSERIEEILFRFPERILLDAAYPATICMVSALMRPDTRSIQVVTEILIEISCCESPAENSDLHSLCMREICRGVPMYFYYLQNSTPYDLSTFSGILNACSVHDNSIASRLINYLNVIKSDKKFEDNLPLIQATIDDVISSQ